MSSKSRDIPRENPNAKPRDGKAGLAASLVCKASCWQGFRFIVPQAACLWSNRASRLVKLILSRQDACRRHCQDGCAPSCYTG